MTHTEEESVSENTMQEFGTHVGRVIRFFNRKGYGFIKDLNDDQDYFIHNSEIKCKEGVYRKLYPGEYVSYNLVDRDEKQVCSGVRGIMGYSLLVENEEHTYRVFPKHEHRGWSANNSSDSGSDSDSDSDSDKDDPNPEPEHEHESELKEFINKEAPEGIEVADFDDLNINEEMG